MRDTLERSIQASPPAALSSITKVGSESSATAKSAVTERQFCVPVSALTAGSSPCPDRRSRKPGPFAGSACTSLVRTKAEIR